MNLAPITMKSLAEGNTIFVEVPQRPKEARGSYYKKVFPSRACNGKREIAPKKKPNSYVRLYLHSELS
jgi:hypothetical protein